MDRHDTRVDQCNLTPWLLCFLVLCATSSRAAAPVGPIKTVVVLVMENRSFDHMLGWMKRLNPHIDGVTGSESNPMSTTDPSSPRIHFKDHAHYVDPDPGHSFQVRLPRPFTLFLMLKLTCRQNKINPLLFILQNN